MWDQREHVLVVIFTASVRRLDCLSHAILPTQTYQCLCAQSGCVLSALCHKWRFLRRAGDQGEYSCAQLGLQLCVYAEMGQDLTL